MLLLVRYARSAAMSSALTRGYAETTSESKTSLSFDVKKLNNIKGDSEAYL